MLKIFADLLKKSKQFLHLLKKFNSIFANVLKKSNQSLHIARNSELIFAHVLKIANLFVEKTLDSNKNNFDKIFLNQYSIINRKIDTLTIYGNKTMNKTINIFQQVSLIL